MKLCNMQVVTQWVWVKGLRVSIRDGCSGSEAQARRIRSGVDTVKPCNNINSKRTSSAVIFGLKQPTLWKPHFQMSSLLCVPRRHTYFIWNDSHSISKSKGEANSLENTMRWVVTCTGCGPHRHLEFYTPILRAARSVSHTLRTSLLLCAW